MAAFRIFLRVMITAGTVAVGANAGKCIVGQVMMLMGNRFPLPVGTQHLRPCRTRIRGAVLL